MLYFAMVGNISMCIWHFLFQIFSISRRAFRICCTFVHRPSHFGGQMSSTRAHRQKPYSARNYRKKIILLSISVNHNHVVFSDYFKWNIYEWLSTENLTWQKKIYAKDDDDDSDYNYSNLSDNHLEYFYL